jgi:hypothetical protein
LNAMSLMQRCRRQVERMFAHNPYVGRVVRGAPSLSFKKEWETARRPDAKCYKRDAAFARCLPHGHLPCPHYASQPLFQIATALAFAASPWLRVQGVRYETYGVRVSNCRISNNCVSNVSALSDRGLRGTVYSAPGAHVEGARRKLTKQRQGGGAARMRRQSACLASMFRLAQRARAAW